MAAAPVPGELATLIQVEMGKWTAAYARRDIAALLDFYHPDATLQIQEQPDVSGLDAVRGKLELWTKAFSEFAVVVNEAEYTGASRDAIFASGTFRCFNAATGLSLGANLLSIWLLVGGRWKIYIQSSVRFPGAVPPIMPLSEPHPQKAPAFKDDALIAALTAANAEFCKRFNAGDSDGIGALYTPDGIVYADHAPPFVGPGAAAGLFGGVIKSGIASVELIITEAGPRASDTIVYERSQFIMRDAAGATKLSGHYIVVWRNVDGQWKLFRDMFATNSA